MLELARSALNKLSVITDDEFIEINLATAWEIEETEYSDNEMYED